MTLVEPASSLTDFFLGAIAIYAAVSLLGTGGPCVHWRWAFVFIGLGAVLGGVHHGFLIDNPTAADISWSAILLIIAVSISFILAGTAATVLGEGPGRFLLALRFVSVAALFVLALFGRVSVPALLITEGLAMIVVLALWLHALRLGQPYAGLFLSAIAVSLMAGAVRGSSANVVFVGLELDTNTLYHLAQMPGVVLLYIAVRRKIRTVEPVDPVRFHAPLQAAGD